METISYLGIISIAILIIPTLFINKYLEIKLNKDIVVSILRMFVQLSIVGLYLQYIFDLNNSLLNIAYMLIMMIVASHSIISSAKFKMNKLFLPIAASVIIPNFLIIIFFNFIVIGLDNPFNARYLITIGGMILGNVLKGDIISIMTFYNGIKDNYNKINYDLALGATLFQATKPYLKKTIKVAIKPSISTAATMGIVSLPGMMTGQILSGSLPMAAIMYQIAIMIAIYVSRYFSVIFLLYLTKNVMFDKNEQLVLDNYNLDYIGEKHTNNKQKASVK